MALRRIVERRYPGISMKRVLVLMLASFMGQAWFTLIQGCRPAQAQIHVVPAQTVPWPEPAPIISRPRTDSSPAGPVGSPGLNDAACDYGCRSRLYQEAYLREQCRASGNRYYYCQNKPLTPAQVDALNDQRKTLRGQYGIYRDGVFYSN